MNKKQYAVVTTISTFYHYYVVDLEDLQKENPESNATHNWLEDSVTLNAVEEFSQAPVGELILESTTLNEEEVLALFDKNHPYLADWDKDRKINWIKKLWSSNNV